MVLQEQLITSHNFWEMLQSGDDKHTELIEGIIYHMEPTGWIHGNLASELDMLIRLFVKQHKLGMVTAAETGFRLNEHTVIAPDVAYIRAERIPDDIPDGFVPFAPDLAVEVMSPRNDATEMSRKVDMLIVHGTKLVWIVHPKTKTVDVYQPGEDHVTIQFLKNKDTLTGGDVLPGFKLLLRELFEA